MTYSAPVMEAARGEARNATRSATSFGRAGRPIGMPPSEFKPWRTLIIGARFLRQLRDQTHGRFRLDPARGDPDHADALRAHFLGQALAVIRERGLRRGIRDGGVGQRHPSLDRSDMDDHSGALFEHHRQERAIQPDRREQVLIESPLPLLVVEYREAARWRR